MRKWVVLFAVVCMVLPQMVQAQLKQQIETEIAKLGGKLSIQAAVYPEAEVLFNRVKEVMGALKELQDTPGDHRKLIALGRQGVNIADEANILFNKLAKKENNKIQKIVVQGIAKVFGGIKQKLFKLILPG